MANEDELRIALSPVQLAAVLSDESVTEGETLSNRLLGGLGLAGGVVELMGAGVLCYAPDPTFITKVGCVVVGTHSLDSIKAASNQMIPGIQQLPILISLPFYWRKHWVPIGKRPITSV